MTHRHNDLFKLPNNIFCSGLNATEITVLAVMYSLRSRSIYKGKKYIKINQKTIAKICGFKTTVTVSKAIDKLCRIGYIERISRYYDDAHKLGAYVYTIPVVRGRYFFVSRKIFKCNLTVAQMRMYLYFCKCSESHSKRFWNSYNDICQELNLKRSAVIKTISELLKLRLIKRYRVRKKDGSYSDNHYKVLTFVNRGRKFTHKKRRRPLSQSILFSKNNVKPIYKIIINQKYIKVNTLRRYYLYFFDLRGSPKIFSTLYSTHFYSNRVRKKLKLYLKYRCNLTIYSSDR